MSELEVGQFYGDRKADNQFEALKKLKYRTDVSVVEFKADPTGSLDSRDAIADADTFATDNNTFVLFPRGVYKVSSALTISNTCIFMPGALLQPASGIAVTLSEQPIAEFHQIFDHSASGSFVHNYKGFAKLDWWDDDATDYTTTLETALGEYQKILFKSGKTYPMDTMLNQLQTITGDVYLKGEDGPKPRLSGDDVDARLNFRDIDSLEVDNLEFYQFDDAFWISQLYQLNYFIVRNCNFLDCNTRSIYVDNFHTNTASYIKRFIIQDNYIADGAGIYANAKIENAIITGNQLSNILIDAFSGCILLGPGDNQDESTVHDLTGNYTISNNTIRDAKVTGAASTAAAQGVNATGRNIVITGNSFRNIKSARTDQADQCGIYCKAVNANISDNSLLNCSSNGSETILIKGTQELDANPDLPHGYQQVIANNVIDAEGWYDHGHTVNYISATTFDISGDLSNFYPVGLRLRFTDATTLFGVITAVDYNVTKAGFTTVVSVLDTGSLSASLSAVEIEENNGNGMHIYSEQALVHGNTVRRCLNDGIRFTSNAIPNISSTVNFTAATNTIDRTAGDTFDGLKRGDRFIIVDAVDAGNNGLFTVKTVTTSQIVTWESISADETGDVISIRREQNRNVIIKDNFIRDTGGSGIRVASGVYGTRDHVISGNHIEHFGRYRQNIAADRIGGIFLEITANDLDFNNLRVNDNFIRTDLVGNTPGGDDPAELSGILFGFSGDRQLNGLEVAHNFIDLDFGGTDYGIFFRDTSSTTAQAFGSVHDNIINATTELRGWAARLEDDEPLWDLRTWNNRDKNGNLIHEIWRSKENGVQTLQITIDFSQNNMAVGNNVVYNGLGSSELILKRAYWHCGANLTSGGAATLAISAGGTASPNIQTASAVNADPYDAGINQSTDTSNLDGTVANMVNVTSNDGNLYFIVATASITGGNITLFLEYAPVHG